MKVIQEVTVLILLLSIVSTKIIGSSSQTTIATNPSNTTATPPPKPTCTKEQRYNSKTNKCDAKAICQDHYTYMANNNTCVRSRRCPNGQYKTPENICADCVKGCGLCHTTANTCTLWVKCSFNYIFNEAYTWKDHCQNELLQKECSQKGANINFFKPYICTLNGNVWLTVLSIFAILFLTFVFIGLLVEEYISPSLVYIKEYFNMSEAMAGVTLLALANGAGDVVTAIVASGSAEGVSYNIGALFGAGLFVCAMVIYGTIKASDDNICVHQNTVYIDVLFYILGCLLVLFFIFYGVIPWWGATSMLLLYLIYVIVTYCKNKDVIDTKEEEQSNEKEKPLLKDYEMGAVKHNEKKEKNPIIMGSALTKKKSFGLKKLLKVTKTQKFKMQKMAVSFVSDVKTHVMTAKLRVEARKHKKDCKKKEVEEGTASCTTKLMHLIELPITYILKFTIPPCEPEQYDNRWVIIWPWLGIPVAGMLNFIKYPDSIKWLYYTPFALLWSVFFVYYGGWKKNDEEQIKKQKYGTTVIFIIEVFGVLCGFFWTAYVSGILIDSLTFIGIITKLSPTYLALTIIGVGNALPDALITIDLASKGQAQMGITGSYAGQLFGLLIGFGLAMLKQSLKTQAPVPVPFLPLTKETFMDLLVLLVTLLVLIATFVYVVSKSKIQNGKTTYFFGCRKQMGLANLILGIYIVFVLGCTGLAVNNAYFSGED